MSGRMRTIGYVLLSGGVDSATALTFAVNQLGTKNVRCVSVDYGQRHKKELEYAAKVAKFYGRPHHILDLSSAVPNTLLKDPSKPLPNASYADLPHGISPTYVPFRNGLMLSALASHIQGIQKEADDLQGMESDVQHDAIIYFGAHAEDAHNWAYPDCTPEFIGSMANAIFIGSYNRIRLVAPWQHMTKWEIIQHGFRHGTPYYMTWSCYAGGDHHCGVCPTCRARKDAFVLAAVPDPTLYEDEMLGSDSDVTCSVGQENPEPEPEVVTSAKDPVMTEIDPVEEIAKMRGTSK